MIKFVDFSKTLKNSKNNNKANFLKLCINKKIDKILKLSIS